MLRSLQAELVDELPPEHPEAIKTRRDLRRINTLMGHVGILARALRYVAEGQSPQARFNSWKGAFSKAGRDAALRRPRTRSACGTNDAPGVDFAQDCAAERGADGASAPSLPCAQTPLRIIEIGAGDGEMFLRVAQRLANKWNNVDVTCVDLQDLLRDETRAAFATLGWRVRAVKSDVLQWLTDTAGEKSDVIIANLFLHHFTDAQLSNLFSLAAKQSDALIALEPRRAGWPLFCARALALIGFSAATCHDAPISVQAGFAGRELSALWPQNGAWELTERRAGLFSHLFIARRKD